MELTQRSTCSGRQIKAVLWTIVMIVTLPLTLTYLLPLYTFRFIVNQLSKIFRKDLGKMMQTRGTIFARDYPKMFESETRCSIVVSIAIDGTLSLESIRQLMLNKIINLKKLSNSSDYVYPELRQTLTSWLGFLFWKWDKKFCINNHVRMYDGPGKVDKVSDTDLLANIKELLPRSFKPNQSPWEIWLWYNAKSTINEEDDRPKTIMVFRIFHSLADGFSVLKLLTSFTGSEIIENVATNSSSSKLKKSNCMNIIWRQLCFPWNVVYEFVNMWIQSTDYNDWHLSEDVLAKKCSSAVSKTISVSLIKDIKYMYETNFQSVLLAAFTGGIRNYMLENGIKIPKKMHCQIPLPFSTHPIESNKIRNHMTIACVPLPLQIPDASTRLRILDHSLKNIVRSTVPLSCFYFFPIIGALPIWFQNRLKLNKAVTCIMSNFPGPLSQVEILGHPVEDISFGAGLLLGNIGVGAASLTYNGQCRLIVGVDEAILCQDDCVQDLLKKMEQELSILKGGQEIV